MSAELTDWAWRQPFSEPAKLTLLALADGAEHVNDVAARTGLPVVAVIDAFHEIARTLAVIWRGRRPFFRIGEAGYVDQAGTPLDAD